MYEIRDEEKKRELINRLLSQPALDVERILNKALPQRIGPQTRVIEQTIIEGDGSRTEVRIEVSVDATGREIIRRTVRTTKRECSMCGRLVSTLYYCDRCGKAVCGACLYFDEKWDPDLKTYRKIKICRNCYERRMQDYENAHRQNLEFLELLHRHLMEEKAKGLW
ncbi:hypothetical protein DRO49_00860 [Candidatus Bathyarchaeota archaeon]|nr:MAG: hypothetical protein DRO49_00860 [Candidatus Bathyarchaeota archaeon]